MSLFIMSERRIWGTVVCHRRDEYGEIFVADDGPLRTLYFGDGIMQSTIRPCQPGSLVEDYSQAMMSALLFKNDPRSVLLIGLGGCSLVHFLMTAFPGCFIDVVEIRQQVIDVAHDFFLLPKENPNLKVFHAAGEDFIRQQGAGCRNYDLIFIDAFDDDGPAAGLSEMPFLSACRQRLNEDGICAINLWHRPKDNFPALYAAMQEAFEGNTLKILPSEAFWNTIAFGFAKQPLPVDHPSYRQTARELQQAYNVNFPKYLKYLYWQNFS